MKDEEANQLQDELIRLQIENARLRAMIDHLERRGGDEPAPLAAETQIIKAEPEPLPARARTSERPKRPRSRKKSEQERESLFPGCLVPFLIFGGVAAYMGLLILSVVLSHKLHLTNFWEWLLPLLLMSPLILAIIGAGVIPIRELRKQQQAHVALLQKRAEQRAKRPRRRITRKLRAATTQKLSEENFWQEA